MGCLLVLMLASLSTGQEFEGHAGHWRNYLNGLLAQLAKEPPKFDSRHELWKKLLSRRVRSFLIGEGETLSGPLGVGADDDYQDLYKDGELPLQLDNGVLNSGNLVGAWREQVADTLLERPSVFQRSRRTTKAVSPAEVFSPYRRTTKRRSTKTSSASSSEHPHLLRFLDIINAHGARRLRADSPQPHILCHCWSGKNGSENDSSDVIMADVMTTSTTTSRQPPLLLVVPGLMVAPRGGPFAVVLDNKTANTYDSGAKLAVDAVSTSRLMPTVKLRRRRLRFVLVLVVFVVALSASLAYSMRSYLARYKREYEIIRNAQFL